MQYLRFMPSQDSGFLPSDIICRPIHLHVCISHRVGAAVTVLLSLVHLVHDTLLRYDFAGNKCMPACHNVWPDSTHEGQLVNFSILGENSSILGWSGLYGERIR